MLKYRIKKLLHRTMLVFALSITSSVHAAHYLIDPYIVSQLGKGIVVDKGFKQWKEFIRFSDTSSFGRIGILVNPIYTNDWLISVECIHSMHLHSDASPWRLSADHHTLAFLVKGNCPIDENSDYFCGIGLGAGGLEAKRYGVFLFEMGYNQHLYNGTYFSINALNTNYFGKETPYQHLNSPLDIRIHAGFKTHLF